MASDVIAAPSVPAALHYLHRIGVVRTWNVHVKRGDYGYAVYFTVLIPGGHSAQLLKVCESRRGRVTGASNISNGEPDCEPQRSA
jgi:hypothetical protein